MIPFCLLALAVIAWVDYLDRAKDGAIVKEDGGTRLTRMRVWR